MTGLCSLCGCLGAVESHHVCGWRHVRDLVVCVCVPCHDYLGAKLRAAGVRLDAKHATESMRRYAIAVGVFDYLILASAMLGFEDVAGRYTALRLRLIKLVIPAGVKPRAAGLVGQRKPTPRAQPPHQHLSRITDLARFMDRAEHLLEEVLP